MYVKPDRRASPMLKPQFKHGGFNMFKHILVPTDGSELSLKALDLACMLVGTGDTTVTVLHVAPGYPAVVGDAGYMAVPVPYEVWEKSGLAQTEKIRDVVEKRANAQSVAVHFVCVTLDTPYAAIIDVALRQKCDVIVMASHGRRGISALLLGSETSKVLTHTNVPVLVCR